MKKILLFCTLLTIIIFFPDSVLASCSNSEKVKLASLAQNVSVTYEPVETETGVTFSLTFTNLQPEFYIKDVTYKYIHYYNGNELILHGYPANRNYRFDIYGIGECNERLYSHYITTPGYNPYYNDPICNGVNNSICQKWVNINYDYNTFVKEVQKIKNILNQKKEPQVIEEPLGIYDYLLKFFINYYYIILPSIIIVCTTIIIVQRKKEDLF